jgi:hypothetical protein
MTLPKISSVPSDAVVPDGDVRGSYGFGRPAHASDPLAIYHFDAGGNRRSRSYKVTWRISGSGPLSAELIESAEAAKRRTRDLFLMHGEKVQVEIWNEDETWQVVSPAGADEWSTSSDD